LEEAERMSRGSKTKILIDGGDPEETLRVQKLTGYVDGQTTNPTPLMCA
jgi:transaldolase